MFDGARPAETKLSVIVYLPVGFQLILQNLGEVGVLEPGVERGDPTLQVSESSVRDRSTEINRRYRAGVGHDSVDEARQKHGFVRCMIYLRPCLVLICAWLGSHFKVLPASRCVSQVFGCS